MSEMLDISYWQGKVSTAAFQSMTGIDRVVLRASRADGALTQDSTYATSVANARTAGKKIGHYHFNGQSGSITAQAEFFVQHISVGAGDVLVLDIETEAGIARRFTPEEAVTWIDRVKALVPGAEVWVYMSQSVTNEANWTEVAKRAKLWVASYSNALGKIGYWSSVVAWQYTSGGSVPGIGGRVDVSRYGTSPVGGSTGAAAVVHVTVPRSVKDIQAKVGTTADGIWGPKTDAAVRAFQKSKGLTVDGIWGPLSDAAAFGGTAQVAAASLAVDGKLGPNTITRWQQVMGTPVDGKISKPSALVRAVQKVVGTAQDGLLGPNTWKGVQKRLGVTVDGIAGTQTISALQRALNEGKF